MSFSALQVILYQVSVTGAPPEQIVQLNGSTLLAITGLLGALSGVIGVLWKNDRDRTTQMMTDLRSEVAEARRERDFYRDQLFQEFVRSERVLGAAEEATKTAGKVVRAVR